MRYSEGLGWVAGYLLGTLTAVGSFLRNSRLFHPRGLLFEIEVDSDDLSPYGFARFSTAWWKKKEWPDALGIAIRFSKEKPKGIKPVAGDQDILFATIKNPAFTVLAPFTTHYHDFEKNTFYAVSPFSVNERLVYLRIKPVYQSANQGSRNTKLLEAARSGKACFQLEYREIKFTQWNCIAKITLREVLNFDQEALRFHPFLNGQGIRPVGFIHYLRKGSYRLGQLARPKTLKDKAS